MARKVKNKYLFKRGGYAVLAIALVIAAAILVNVLVGVFADRMDLEFDLTPDKKNSLSAENEKFIKDIKKEVVIYVLAASEADYPNTVMEIYSQYFYIAPEENEYNYYKQTPKLLSRYADLNDNVKLVYVDMYGNEAADIVKKFPDIRSNCAPGDILVTCEFTTAEGKEITNYRNLSVDDIYIKVDTSGMAAMNMGYYNINGSNLETSLTSALLSVTSEDTKKVAYIAEKSAPEAFDYFRSVMELNNFIIEEVGIGEPISAEYDIAVLCAPTSDFTSEELDVLSIFLDNDGKLGKTLLFYGDTQYQNLPNFYNFLADWGIVAEGGIAWETNGALSSSTDPTVYFSNGMTGVPFNVGTRFLSGYNVPMRAVEGGLNGRTATAFLTTNGTSVILPTNLLSSVESSEELFEEIEKLPKVSLASAIISTEEDYNNEKQESIFSHVIAFSSYDFISKGYIERYKSNFDYVGLNLNAVKYATGMNDESIIIEPKILDDTVEKYVVSERSVRNMKIVFVYVIPVLILVLAFVIFFIRRNK